MEKRSVSRQMAADAARNIRHIKLIMGFFIAELKKEAPFTDQLQGAIYIVFALIWSDALVSAKATQLSRSCS